MELKDRIHILGKEYKMDFSRIVMDDIIKMFDEVGTSNADLFIATTRVMEKVLGKEVYRQIPLTHAEMVHNRILGEIVACFAPDKHWEDEDDKTNRT